MDEPAPPDLDDRRFFFVHVQKTAGTSLLVRLQQQFADRQIYPDPALDGDLLTVMPQIEVPVLREQWEARRDEIRVVTGHFPLCTTELLDGSFTTFTVLREPVERTLSYLRHHRKYTKSARKLSLEQIYDDRERFKTLVENHMVKMFSLTTAEMVGGFMTEVDFTPAHLVRAEEQLGTVDVVGVQERFEPFCAELCRRFGWDLGPPVRANHTDHVDVDPAFRDRIAEDNALDVAFYDYARRIAV